MSTTALSGRLGASGTTGRRHRFRAALGRVWRSLWGVPPWPPAGRAGAGSAAVMVLAAVAYVLSQVPTGGFGAPAERFFGNDLVAYLTGTALLLQGDAHQLYDYARQLETQQRLMGALGLETRGMEYVNPPLWAALLVPLFALGIYAADLTWRALTVIGSGWALLKLAAASATARRGALLLLCFFPFVQGLHHRSMVLVLIAAFAGWATLSAAGRPFAAGLALSLLGLKPQYVLFPFLFLLWRREWTQLRAFVLGGVVQIVLTLAIMAAPGQGLPTFEAVAPFIGVGSLGGANSGAVVDAHVNLRAALLRLAPEAPSLLQLALLAASTLAAVGLVLRALGCRAPSHGAFTGWELLAVAAATNVTAPYNHTTGLVLLMVPAAMLLCRPASPGPGASRALAIALCLPSLGILMAPLSAWLYIAACWLTASLALGAGLLGARAERKSPAHAADR